MHNKFLSLHLDFIGFSTSLVCAIHCAFLPYLISSLPLLGLGILQQPWVESGLIAISAVLAVLALSQGFISHHRSVVPVLVVASGFILISIGLFVLPESLEELAIPIGASVISLGHYLNWQKIRASKSQFPAYQNPSES